MGKRVYFAFDYQDVIDFRANVVRNHSALRGVAKAGYYDHSIWEEARKKSPLALKRMINAGLRNTSVTVLLIGSRTWIRRWVRYEIIRSVARGNQLVGIHINGIRGRDGKTKPRGLNPYSFLGMMISRNGKSAMPAVRNGLRWQRYLDHLPFDVDAPPSLWGKHVKLSRHASVYDWVADKGYENFSSWIS